MTKDNKQVPPPVQDNTPAPLLTPEQKRERSLGLDRMVTWALIIFAVFSVFSGLADYINPRPVLNAMYAELNRVFPEIKLTTFTNIGFATTMGWFAVTIQAVVLATMIWFSQQRMKAKKFSWWIPVVAAFIAHALSTVCIGIALLSDPGFQEGISRIASGS